LKERHLRAALSFSCVSKLDSDRCRRQNRALSTNTDSSPAGIEKPASSRVGYFRWVICGLLLLGTTKNYMDRQLLGVLKMTLQHDFGWNEIDYSNLVLAFQAAYGLGMLGVGWLIDRLGTRIGYAIAMTFWSLASMAHAFGRSLTSFLVFRSALGLGESAVFPASLKTVAEWFPKKERALATGIFNAGTNLGAIITPLAAPWITIHWGWRWSFLLMGGVGFIWLAAWLAVYQKPEQHPRLTSSELAYIQKDPQERIEKVPWLRLIPHRQTWAFSTAKFITDPVWYFYLFWIPDFLQRRHGLSLTAIGLPIVAIYLLSDLGCVLGGGLSSWLLARGKSLNSARKLAMLVCAICVVPIVFAYRAENTWTAVLLIGLAAAAHQGFSTNLLTLPSDMFPAQAVASVVGIGGTAGAIGGMLIAQIVGYILQSTGSYMLPFLIAGCAYLVALCCLHLIAPRIEDAKLKPL